MEQWLSVGVGFKWSLRLVCSWVVKTIRTRWQVHIDTLSTSWFTVQGAVSVNFMWNLQHEKFTVWVGFQVSGVRPWDDSVIYDSGLLIHPPSCLKQCLSQLSSCRAATRLHWGVLQYMQETDCWIDTMWFHVMGGSHPFFFHRAWCVHFSSVWFNLT